MFFPQAQRKATLEIKHRHKREREPVSLLSL